MNTILEVLHAMDQKFSAPEIWTQQAWARNAKGHGIFEHNSDAICWSLLGCLMLLTEVSHSGELSQLGKETKTYLEKEVGQELYRWNDKPERTFQDVKDLLARTKAVVQAF